MSTRNSVPFSTLLFLGLLLLLAPFTVTNAQAALLDPNTTASPIVAAAKVACNTSQLNALRAGLEQARAGWVADLAPQAHQNFSTARGAFVKYVSRCAKKLGLDVNAELSNIAAYDAPAVGSAKTPVVVTPSAVNGNGFFFDGSPGTAAPPGSLGFYSMTQFLPDPRPVFTDVNQVNSPFGGALIFSDPVNHLNVGNGSWAAWSHDYEGDVYFVEGDTITLFLPPNTRAFYFYAEPNSLNPFNFEATANDGTSSYFITIESDAGGAKYFGFYAPVSGPSISSITVKCYSNCTDTSASGFAIGEFGIYQNGGADLRVSKFSEPHDEVLAGDVFTYSIFVDNFGPDVAHHVVVSDTLLNSGAVLIQSCAFSVSQGGGSISQFTCNTGEAVSTQFGSDIGTFATDDLDPLTPTTPGRLRASFRLRANGPIDLTNITRVGADTFDPNLDNNMATDEISVVSSSDLNLIKTAPASAGAGEDITYTLTISNGGTYPSTGVEVSDFLPAGFKVKQVTSDQGSCAPGVPGDALRPMVCQLGSLDGLAATNVTVLGQVMPDVPGDSLLFNDAQVTADGDDKSPADNIDSVSTAIVATCGSLPAKPAQISPLDGRQFKKATVLLDWIDSNCALQYRVIIRQDSKIAPNFILAENLPVSQYTTGKLPKGHDYYWRVVACNGAGCKRSGWRVFTIKP